MSQPAAAVAVRDVVPVREVAAELQALLMEQLTYRENLEPLAARIGLSHDATMQSVDDCTRRLRLLTAAWRHFDALPDGVVTIR